MSLRGERNNNPGNIRLSSVKFKGEIEGNDTEFKTFSSAHYGIRGIAKILLTYYNLYDLDTTRKVINRWAPPSENNTDAYIKNVAFDIGVGPDDVIDVTNEKVLDKLTTAIIFHEEGEVAYSSDEIMSAVDDALGA